MRGASGLKDFYRVNAKRASSWLLGRKSELRASSALGQRVYPFEGQDLA